VYSFDAWYDHGMTRYEKIAISLPSRVAENARRAVKAGEAPSLSAYIVAALEQKMQPGDLEKMLDEMLLASGGPMTDRERHEADELLGVAPRRTQRARSARSPRKRR